MAIQQQDQPVVAAPPAPPTAQIVGNAFVHQYYHILHQSPELVFRFYNERSKLGRPNAEGGMSSVTTMQAINEKILSLDYCNYKGDISTIDAQDSFDGGVLVLVTGYLHHKDGGKRKFTQSFFLAPQDNGYYVLNDMFRYVEESTAQQGNQDLPDGPGTPIMPEQEIPPVQEQQIPEQPAAPNEEEETIVEEVYNPSDNEEGSVVDEEIPMNEVVVEVPNGTQAVGQSCYVTAIHEETPKKSYASIVKVMKENVSPLSLPAQPVVKPVPVKPERQANPQTLSLAPETVPSISVTSDNGAVHEAEADGFSIYIKNLPMNATPPQLEEEFKRFGPIKNDGIQVRSHKQQGFCFGFVEFEVAAAVQSAIEASPITIGGRQAYVEEKRASGSRGNNRGRFALGRGGGFRNDGTRGGHGNYNGVRGGYARGEFVNRGDFGSRGNGRGESGNRGDRGYQRVDNGGRMNRPGGFGANTSKVAPRVTAPA